MFNSPLTIIALIGFAVLAVPYVLGPVLIYFVQRFRVPVNLVPLDPQSDLPIDARQYFGEVYTALTADGFELAVRKGRRCILCGAVAMLVIDHSGKVAHGAPAVVCPPAGVLSH